LIGRHPPPVHVCLISRQRIVGKTNGSSAYVLSIAEYLKSKGCRIRYLSPSPATFGRWPFIRLRPEMDVFETVQIRGSLRLGRFLILLDPAVLCRAAVAIFDQFLARTGLSDKRFGRRAPYSIAADLLPADRRFLAKHVRDRADILLLDYAFMTPCLEHVHRPGIPSVVIMHDLFSARAGQFDVLNKTDTAAALSEPDEMALLSAADLVVAIQADEAAIVRNRLPGCRVVVAPMAATPVGQAHIGDGDHVLFVGSQTAPNIDALQWLVEEIWPAILSQRPSSRLLVAGSVTWAYSARAPGVEYLGVVSDLGQLYERAAVVISPLRVGSGLKVKLVEAMGRGKAVVATSVTAQGIQSVVKDAIVIADSAAAIVEETLSLMSDTGRRRHYANAALQVARTHFGEEACYREIFGFVAEKIGARRSSESTASVAAGSIRPAKSPRHEQRTAVVESSGGPPLLG
jgi:succinoglycan biosynthesis protein ExoO